MGASCCPQTVVNEVSFQLPTNPSENRYINRNYLSEGGHGKVYKAYDEHTKKFVCCKETPKKKKNRALREANILKQFNSPVLPHYLDIQFEDKVNCLYYEFIPGTDLFTYLFEYDKTFDYNDVKVLIKKMLYCLEELERYNLVHLDIKFENFVLTESNGVLTLIDFEGAHAYPNTYESLKTYVGTRSFTAPETWCGSYHKSSDIWSIGVCLWCILTGQQPFNVDILTRNEEHIIRRIKKRFKFPQKRHLEKMNELDFDENLRDLFDQVFKFDASRRIDMDKLKRHIWLTL